MYKSSNARSVLRRVCVCDAEGCERRRQRIAYCRQHWHLSSALSIEIRTVRLFRESHTKMLPADIQAWTTISPKLPISVLWIAAQLWEPLAVEHFVSKFKVQSESQRPLRAAALGNAFASTALHMHELGQKDDGVAMAHLSLLGEQGMCRFFCVVALGQRLGLLKDAPSLKRARGDRVP